MSNATTCYVTPQSSYLDPPPVWHDKGYQIAQRRLIAHTKDDAANLAGTWGAPRAVGR
jgi:hypothetical protein